MKLAFLFPGQGSQKQGMGSELYQHSAAAKALLDEASEATGIDFKQLMFAEDERLHRSEFTQPAIVLCSLMALSALWEASLDCIPIAQMGHSLGEYSALAGAGALDFMEVVTLVRERGKLMQEAAEGQGHGMMVVLGLEDDSVESICMEARSKGRQIWPANFNSDGQVVIAGVKSDLEDSIALFQEAGAKRAMLLEMSVASHCPLLDSITKPFAERLKVVLRTEFKQPVISNVTAKAYQERETALDLLPRQLLSPVLYKQSIMALESDVDAFVELGHGGVLKGLNRRITKKPTHAVSDPASLEAFLEAIR